MNSPLTEIVILDDDANVRSSLELILAKIYRVHSYSEVGAAEAMMKMRNISVAILDLNMPNLSGLDILADWKKKYPETEILFCSGEQRVEKAIECLRRGASDFIVKPFHHDDLQMTVARAVERQRIRRQAESLKPLIHPQPVTFIGSSHSIKEVLEKVKLLKKQSHLNVLILGESGTGKEILARLIHQQENSHQRPFVVVNMPAIPASLMEAELFGVEKGAYTDAKVSRSGKFELANGGDLFLDEIGDLPLDTQSKILRALQERQIERVGSNRISSVNFRAISATNQPLADLMSNGRFREDLIYRLSDLVLWLPPLREHKEDLPALTDHFLKKYSYGRKEPVLSEVAQETLQNYHWPGNVRQLESTIKRAIIFNPGPIIERIEIFDPTMLKPNRLDPISNFLVDGKYEKQLVQFEKQLLEKTLARHSGNKQNAMDELGLSRATFYRKLSQLGLN